VGAKRGRVEASVGLERFGCLGLGVWVVMALLSAGAGVVSLPPLELGYLAARRLGAEGPSLLTGGRARTSARS
jgi:hypothetical protein